MSTQRREKFLPLSDLFLEDIRWAKEDDLGILRPSSDEALILIKEALLES
jgi:hypothetical protein